MGSQEEAYVLKAKSVFLHLNLSVQERAELAAFGLRCARDARAELLAELANEADCRLENGGDIAGFAAYLHARANPPAPCARCGGKGTVPKHESKWVESMARIPCPLCNCAPHSPGAP